MLFWCRLPRCWRILREFPADAVLADPGFTAWVACSEAGDPPYATYGISALTLTSRDTARFGTALPPDYRLLVGAPVQPTCSRRRFTKLLFRDVNAHGNRVRAGLGLPPFPGKTFCMRFRRICTSKAARGPLEYPRSDLPPQEHLIGPLLPEAPRDFAPPDSGRPISRAD